MLKNPRFLDPMHVLTATPWASVVVREKSIVLALAIGGGLTHALNMFNYPSWVASGQEGATVYRAWALLRGRELWGDLLSNAPATTLLLAGWLTAAGGLHSFGTAVEGGRLLMLALHVGAVPLLYALARLLGCGVLAAAFAAALFTLSPLVIAQQRLVVPNNFVSFWTLLGLYLLLRRTRQNPPRPGGMWLWVVRIAGGGCIALAYLSFELTAAADPGNGSRLENLLATLKEPFLAFGAAAVIANLARGRRDPRALLIGVAGAIPLGLAIEGISSSPAFELAIPFSLNIGVAVAPALDRLPLAPGRIVTAAVLALFVTQYATTFAFQALYLQRPTAAEREALAWTRAHIPSNSTITVGPWAWPGLAEAGPDGAAFTGLRPTPEADSSEYALIASDLTALSAPHGSTVRADSQPGRGGLVKRWVSDGTEVELWKTRRLGATEPALLAGSAQYLARRFERGGAFTSLDGTVTAQSQANAMLRAVWSEDRAGFMRAWRWTSENLVNPDGLLASTWRNGAIVSSGTTADADVDTAFALLTASRQWVDEELLVAGRRMVDGIWRREVVPVRGRPYPAAGDWASGAPIIALNPGSFAPYAYQAFADVDPAHDWLGLIESGYRVLAAASAPDPVTNPVGLPPDWIGLDAATGNLVPLPGAGREAVRYGDDAARTYWRVALHLRWTGEARAERYLRGASFLRDEVARRGIVARIYARDGSILDPYPGGAGNAAAIAALLTVDPPAAHSLYAAQIVGAANRLGAGVYWGELNDLRSQEWGWLAAAFYADRLPSPWQRSSPRPMEPAR